MKIVEFFLTLFLRIMSLLPQRVQFFPSKIDFSTKYMYKKDGSIKKQNGKVLTSALNLFSRMENGIEDNLKNSEEDW